MHIPTVRDARTGHRGRDVQTLQDGHDETGGPREGRTGAGEPGLLGRNPRRLWVADIAQARRGWLYLAVVLNAWSRWIIGWAMPIAVTYYADADGGYDGRLVQPERHRSCDGEQHDEVEHGLGFDVHVGVPR